MTDIVPIRRALISVSDKTGLLEFAQALAAAGVEIISTGGTAATLAKAGLNVIPIDRVTAFPEIMGGRVKTLHPAVHGGLLAVRDNPEHVAAMHKHGISPIDLVCVNLYPFEATVAKPGVTREEAIENVDIGGPSMIRSAAKNHAFVTVVTDPAQYAEVIAELKTSRGTSLALRKRLALAAYTRTSQYDAAISTYLSSAGLGETGIPPVDSSSGLPATQSLKLSLKQELRYGENPHQPAALYTASNAPAVGSLIHAKQLHGKELSYNNINDAAAALELVRQLKSVTSPAGPVGTSVWASLAAPGSNSFSAAAVVKHMNPCGAAIAASALDAVNSAIAGDPIAAYGGILALSTALDEPAADRLCEKDIFMEVIAAPAFTPGAIERLQKRWANLRLLETGELAPPPVAEMELRSVPGPGQGYLAQLRDTRLTRIEEYQHRAGPAPSPAILAQASALEAVCRALTSNAVCLGGRATDGSPHAVRLFGAGAGQMDRVTSCRLATEKAGPLAKGAIAFSDAFFPFSDGPQILIEAGVKTIIHPGGSKRDEDTFALCNKRGVTCLTNGLRHFRH